MSWWFWFLIAYWVIAIALIRPIFSRLSGDPAYRATNPSRTAMRGDSLLLSAVWLFALVVMAAKRVAKGIGWLLFRETKRERAYQRKKDEEAQTETNLRTLYATEPGLLPTRERERIKRMLEIEKLERKTFKHRSFSEDVRLETLQKEIKRIDEIAREIDERELKRA